MNQAFYDDCFISTYRLCSYHVQTKISHFQVDTSNEFYYFLVTRRSKQKASMRLRENTSSTEVITISFGVLSSHRYVFLQIQKLKALLEKKIFSRKPSESFYFISTRRFFRVWNENCLCYILQTYPYIPLCSLHFKKSGYFLNIFYKICSCDIMIMSIPAGCLVLGGFVLFFFCQKTFH